MLVTHSVSTCPGCCTALSDALLVRARYYAYHVMGPGSAVHRQERCTASGTRSIWIVASSLGKPFQVGGTDFEILADHVVDVVMHDPRTTQAGAIRQGGELICGPGLFRRPSVRGGVESKPTRIARLR